MVLGKFIALKYNNITLKTYHKTCLNSFNDAFTKLSHTAEAQL
jgi:hypothetical protein